MFSGICNISPRSLMTISPIKKMSIIVQTKIHDDNAFFPCPAILSFSRLTATAPASLVIWGLSERVPANVCCATVLMCQQSLCNAPSTYTSCSTVSYTQSVVQQSVLHQSIFTQTECRPASWNQGVTAIYHIHPPMHTHTHTLIRHN